MSESYTGDPAETRALPPYLPPTGQAAAGQAPAAHAPVAAPGGVPPVLPPQGPPAGYGTTVPTAGYGGPVPTQPTPPAGAPSGPVAAPPTRASLRQAQPTETSVVAASPAAPQAQPAGYPPPPPGYAERAPAAVHVPQPPAQQGTGQPAQAGGGPAPRTGAPQRAGMGQRAEEGDLSLDAVLVRMVQLGASDLHLTSGSQPMVRVSGSLHALEEFPMLAPEPLRRSIYSVLTQKQREQFEANLELDFAYAVRGHARFRVNLYQQRESVGAVFRVIPYEIKSLESLGVPPVVGSFAGLPRGLVLVTGPTGSGKSTTLAAVIDLANRTRSDHIMTVEDPIEFLHRHKRSLINQREVGADTHSFANALKHVLRQDPDIILVGEMRDLETISVALTAAETGHLVFATLHTQDAAQTIDRIIDVFPSHQQDQVRTQLAASLQAVVCQTLCKTANGQGRVVATEVMVATPAIRNLIREGKTHQIYSSMQAGTDAGMHTLDQNLAELVRTGKVTYEVALEKAHHTEDFNKMVGRTARMNQGASALNSSGMAGSAAGFGGQY
ncbi:PilT/PilU family type 4a pilus ATPase [Cellulomonas sp. Y8]|uniref:type IV pilus twitching motility protein PilT n=1 Tax=Cellulomonas sp. Y8 TaxID=2591145 RepID=UPI003D725EF0